jgi:hypothetical protein
MRRTWHPYALALLLAVFALCPAIAGADHQRHEAAGPGPRLVREQQKTDGLIELR